MSQDYSSKEEFERSFAGLHKDAPRYLHERSNNENTLAEEFRKKYGRRQKAEMKTDIHNSKSISKRKALEKVKKMTGKKEINRVERERKNDTGVGGFGRKRLSGRNSFGEYLDKE